MSNQNILAPSKPSQYAREDSPIHSAFQIRSGEFLACVSLPNSAGRHASDRAKGATEARGGVSLREQSKWQQHLHPILLEAIHILALDVRALTEVVKGEAPLVRRPWGQTLGRERGERRHPSCASLFSCCQVGGSMNVNVTSQEPT
eukprot:scaffold68813_cov32-Tisochrysis_lutea.AAC.1